MGKERYIFTGIIIYSAYDFSFSTCLVYFYQHHYLWIQKSYLLMGHSVVHSFGPTDLFLSNMPFERNHHERVFLLPWCSL